MNEKMIIDFVPIQEYIVYNRIWQSNGNVVTQS